MSSTHDSGGTVDGTLGQSAKGDHYFALPAGTELLEYQIEALLGHGGFGITYRAIDRVLRQSVAVKEYFPNDIAVRMSEKTVTAKSIGDAPEFKIGLDSFLEEARVISRFRHPNIVRVRRFFELHGTAYIALDYEQGRTLSQRLAAGAVPEPELLQILRGIIDGLETVHEQAVLHRDLKPSNVILRDDNTPVLIDFGAARDFRERHSRSITAIAAPGYSPPEQYGVGGQQGPWTDIYALGAIAYKCVTGNTPPESLRRLRNDPIIPASKAAAGKYNPELLGTIDWMLSIEEANRPGSVQFVRDRLEPSPTGAAKRTPARRGARLQPPSQRWLPLAAVLVAVFAIGAFTATTNFGWIRGMFAPAAKPAAAAVETTRETPRVASAAPSPPAPRVAPDDAAWKEIKDGSDIGQLRHFLEQFPNSTHHDAATQKLAALTPPPPPPVPRAAPPELPPPPPAPAADEIAWDFLKDSRDAALLRQFVERFPTSSRRAAAEARLAMLEQQSRPAPAPEPPRPSDPFSDATLVTDPVLVNEIRSRLYELNFDPGAPNQTAQLQQAVRDYEATNQLAADGVLTKGLLNRLRGLSPLRPWGSIVYGRADEKWGMSWAQETRREAIASARASCNESCPTEVSFFGTDCAAFAHSDASWAIVSRSTLELAKEAALADCRRNGKSCTLVASVCADGSGRTRR